LQLAALAEQQVRHVDQEVAIDDLHGQAVRLRLDQRVGQREPAGAPPAHARQRVRPRQREHRRAVQVERAAVVHARQVDGRRRWHRLAPRQLDLEPEHRARVAVVAVHAGRQLQRRRCCTRAGVRPVCDDVRWRRRFAAIDQARSVQAQGPLQVRLVRASTVPGEAPGDEARQHRCQRVQQSAATGGHLPLPIETNRSEEYAATGPATQAGRFATNGDAPGAARRRAVRRLRGTPPRARIAARARSAYPVAIMQLQAGQRPLSLAKLTAPQPNRAWPRARLFERLDAARRGGGIVWIAAPAGSGKTTLVASYLQARRLRAAWYRVDAADADVASFFHYLGQAAKPP